MVYELIQLIILFAVIFDPLASLAVFFTATERMSEKDRRMTAVMAVIVAATLSLLVLILGKNLLTFFSTTLDEFRVAGGIILALLGIQMTLGFSLSNFTKNESSGRAIAAIIGTPLLSGPAAITAIIVAVEDYGRVLTFISVAFVLLTTLVLFLFAERVHKFFGKTATQVISTVLGLVTLSWGVKFITTGLMAIF